MLCPRCKRARAELATGTSIAGHITPTKWSDFNSSRCEYLCLCSSCLCLLNETTKQGANDSFSVCVAPGVPLPALGAMMSSHPPGGTAYLSLQPPHYQPGYSHPQQYPQQQQFPAKGCQEKEYSIQNRLQPFRPIPAAAPADQFKHPPGPVLLPGFSSASLKPWGAAAARNAGAEGPLQPSIQSASGVPQWQQQQAAPCAPCSAGASNFSTSGQPSRSVAGGYKKDISMQHGLLQGNSSAGAGRELGKGCMSNHRINNNSTVRPLNSQPHQGWQRNNSSTAPPGSTSWGPHRGEVMPSNPNQGFNQPSRDGGEGWDAWNSHRSMPAPAAPYAGSSGGRRAAAGAGARYGVSPAGGSPTCSSSSSVVGQRQQQEQQRWTHGSSRQGDVSTFEPPIGMAPVAAAEEAVAALPRASSMPGHQLEKSREVDFGERSSLKQPQPLAAPFAAPGLQLISKPDAAPGYPSRNTGRNSMPGADGRDDGAWVGAGHLGGANAGRHGVGAGGSGGMEPPLLPAAAMGYRSRGSGGARRVSAVDTQATPEASLHADREAEEGRNVHAEPSVLISTGVQENGATGAETPAVSAGGHTPPVDGLAEAAAAQAAAGREAAAANQIPSSTLTDPVPVSASLEGVVNTLKASSGPNPVEALDSHVSTSAFKAPAAPASAAGCPSAGNQKCKAVAAADTMAEHAATAALAPAAAPPPAPTLQRQASTMSLLFSCMADEADDDSASEC